MIEEFLMSFSVALVLISWTFYVMYFHGSVLIFHMALQIPEEEKNLGPHDRLIHVYHFMKDTSQNQVVCISYQVLRRNFYY